MVDVPIHRIALVSCAMHQPMYAPVFAAHPRLEIACVVDDPHEIDEYVVETNRAVAAQYGVPYVESIEAVAEDATIDICSVCPQLERRGRISARLAQAGKHLFMDKPHAISLDEARAIADAAETHGVCTVIYGRQMADVPQKIKQQLTSGAIGDLVAIHWDLIFAKGDAGKVPDEWVACISRDMTKFTFRASGCDPSGSGHNVWAKRELHEIGLYPVGLTQFLVDAPVSSVYSQLGQYWLASHAERQVEDFAVLQMQFANGVTATITTGRYGCQTDPGSGVDKVAVIGTKGTIVADGSPPMAMTYAPVRDDGKSATRLDALDVNGIGRLVSDLITSIDNGRETINNATHGVSQVEVLLAGYASYFSGEPVQLPLS